MRQTRKILAAAALVLGAFPLFASSPEGGNSVVPDFRIPLQGGPGLAVSGSGTVEQLPEKARQLLKEYYGDQTVTSVKLNFLKHTEDVELNDGTKITFSGDGDVLDVYQGSNKPINPEMLGQILPMKTVEHLLQAGVAGEVSGVKNAYRKGHAVILLDNMPPQMIFDVDGVFVITAY